MAFCNEGPDAEIRASPKKRMQKKEYSLETGGKTMIAEFNDWANQANGSVLLRYGNSACLATVVMSNRESNLDYFPLSVEYEEKFYAAGAILGSRFMRREGRPSDEAVLSGRIVDRTIRPLFPKGLKRDVQVIINMIEVGAREVPEAVLEVGLKKASEEIEKMQVWQQMIVKERGVEKKTEEHTSELQSQSTLVC